MTQNSFQFEAKITAWNRHVTAILTCNTSTCLFWLALGDWVSESETLWPRRSVLVSLWFTPLVFWYLWIGFFGFHMLWVCKVNYCFQDCCLCLFCFQIKLTLPIFEPNILVRATYFAIMFLAFWASGSRSQLINRLINTPLATFSIHTHQNQ